MAEISYRRHRFPPVIIQHAVWLYLRFTLSYRDVEELLAERGLDILRQSTLGDKHPLLLSIPSRWGNQTD
jgi:transposase-like protein